MCPCVFFRLEIAEKKGIKQMDRRQGNMCVHRSVQCAAFVMSHFSLQLSWCESTFFFASISPHDNASICGDRVFCLVKKRAAQYATKDCYRQSY